MGRKGKEGCVGGIQGDECTKHGLARRPSNRAKRAAKVVVGARGCLPRGSKRVRHGEKRSVRCCRAEILLTATLRHPNIVCFRGDVHPQNAGRTALSQYAVDVAGQHPTERFPPWRTILHPRGTHPCAPPSTFARPAHPFLVRLLGRRPSFVHSSPCIPPTHPSLPFPPIAHGAGDP